MYNSKDRELDNFDTKKDPSSQYRDTNSQGVNSHNIRIDHIIDV